MRRSIIKCRKCGELKSVRLPSGAEGFDKRSHWGRGMTLPKGPLSRDVFSHLFYCRDCGGKYSHI